jgi:hypothetical protein
MSGARKDGAGSTDAPSKALRMAEAAAEVGEDLGIEAPRTGDASPGPYGRAGSAFDEDNVPMPRTSDVRHSSTCIAGISPGADCTCTEGLYTQTSRTPEGTGDTPRDENEAVLARTAASGGIIGPPDLSEPRTETATAERLEISRRAHQADRERLAALQREIGPLRAAARAVVRECIDGGVDNAVLDRLVKVDLVAALGDERVRPTATATFIVTRTSSARYLGAYEWVRNAAKAAHFVTREAAEAAADVARQSNGGVTVEEYFATDARGQRRESATPNPDRVCSTCGKSGHWYSECKIK